MNMCIIKEAAGQEAGRKHKSTASTYSTCEISLRPAFDRLAEIHAFQGGMSSIPYGWMEKAARNPLSAQEMEIPAARIESISSQPGRFPF